MKKTLKILGYTIASIIGIIILLVLGIFLYLNISAGNIARKARAMKFGDLLKENLSFFSKMTPSAISQFSH